MKVVLVMATVKGVSNHRCQGAAAAAGPAGPLLVIGDAWRHIAQADAEQAANIYAHLHGGGH